MIQSKSFVKTIVPAGTTSAVAIAILEVSRPSISTILVDGIPTPVEHHQVGPEIVTLSVVVDIRIIDRVV